MWPRHRGRAREWRRCRCRRRPAASRRRRRSRAWSRTAACELCRALEQRRSRAGVIAAMGGASFVRRIGAAEMIDADLQVAGRRVAGLGVRSRQRRNSTVSHWRRALLDVEHRAGIGLAVGDHRRRHAQDVVHDAAQAAVGAGRDVDRVEAPAPDQGFGAFAVARARRWIRSKARSIRRRKVPRTQRA